MSRHRSFFKKKTFNMKKADELIHDFWKRVSASETKDNVKISLTQQEDDILKILTSVVDHFSTGTTLRVAGGWVRDKILGKSSKDIDIALDNISGEKFARLVNEWLKLNGRETKSIGIISANPDQSKHLETATTFINGLPIDFVNLRTEQYSDSSRIPTIAIGTPEQDALRRDLTINSLFYNVNLGIVEDFTGHGLADLKQGIIRTPLDPLQTFKDDPLRVLRAIRFATRYGFELDPALSAAASNAEIVQALSSKISKERIGAELKGIFKGKDPGRALAIMKELGIRDAVLNKPDNTSIWDMDQNNPHHEMVLWDHLAKVVSTLNDLIKDKSVSDDDRVILLLAAFLHDIGKLDKNIQGEKQVENQMVSTYHGHELSSKIISEHILKDLRFSNKEIEDVLALIEPAGNAEKLVREVEEGREPTRKALAKFVKSIGEKWKHAIYLAMADEASKKMEGLSQESWPHFEGMISTIENLNVDKAHETKPLLNGDEIKTILNIKPGPELGVIIKDLLDWQFTFPGASKEDAQAWVLKKYLRAFLAPLSLNKKAAVALAYDKGYVYYPVERPDFDIPVGLKDRGEFHITIIKPNEVKALKTSLGKEVFEKSLNEEMSVFSNGSGPQIVGLGKHQDVTGDIVYFVVVDWPEAQSFRARFDLPLADLHITMAFSNKDIHGVRKDRSTIVKS